jgi:hypothetical protein
MNGVSKIDFIQLIGPLWKVYKYDGYYYIYNALPFIGNLALRLSSLIIKFSNIPFDITSSYTWGRVKFY